VAAVVEGVTDRRDLTVHHPRWRDHVGTCVGLRPGDPPVQLDGPVIVDVALVVQDAAVAVVGVLVQAEVAKDHVVVAELLAQEPEGPLGDAVRIPRLGALGVLPVGDAEQHERDESFGGDLVRLLAKGLQRMLGLPRHRCDGRRFGDALLHEQWSDQVAGREVGLSDQRAERGGPAHPSRSALWERHGGMVARARDQAPPKARSRALISPSIV
jgi:hypothetical protein